MSFLKPVPPPREGTPRTAANGTNVDAYVTKVLDGVAGAAYGTRNDTLNRAAHTLGRLVAAGQLDYGLTAELLQRTGEAAGLDAREIPGTIRSGLSSGEKNPRTLEERDTWKTSANTTMPQAANGSATSGSTGAAEGGSPNASTAGPSGKRSLALTSAAGITIRPVRWLWDSRIALGTLALLGGREGIGKSTVAYQLAADITRGTLPGEHLGQPRAIIVAATEDSWSHTIVPRLLAADADLNIVYRVDVTTSEHVDTGLSLPQDLPALEQAVQQVGGALILLDPLMSRLDAGLDTHKDAEVRQALEPLTALADRTGAAIIGLIHVNKSSSTDPLTMLMGSRAFAAVARAVLFLMTDPDNEDLRLLGQPKNNLGRIDLPTMTFTIGGKKVAETDEGPIWTSHIRWGSERSDTIREVLESTLETSDVRTGTKDAAEWIIGYLTEAGGTVESSKVKEAGKARGFSESMTKRGFRAAKCISERAAIMHSPTYWKLPAALGPWGDSLSETSGPSGPSGPHSVHSGHSDHSQEDPPRANVTPLDEWLKEH